MLSQNAQAILLHSAFAIQHSAFPSAPSPALPQSTGGGRTGRRNRHPSQLPSRARWSRPTFHVPSPICAHLCSSVATTFCDLISGSVYPPSAPPTSPAPNPAESLHRRQSSPARVAPLLRNSLSHSPVAAG